MSKNEATNKSNKKLQDKLKKAQEEDAQEIQKLLEELGNSKITFKGFITAIVKKLSIQLEINDILDEDQ